MEWNVVIRDPENGTTSPAPGEYITPDGYSFAVFAVPDPGYEVDYWLLNGEYYGDGDSIRFTVDQDYEVVVYFRETAPEPPPEEPTPPEGKYVLTIEQPDHGTTDPAPGDHEYSEGETVTITAIPDEGYQVAEWHLDDVFAGTEETLTVTMDQNHRVSVIFEEKPPEAAWPWNVLIGFLTGIADLFVRALKALALEVSKPIEGIIQGLVDTITNAVTPGSPDKEIEQRAKRLAALYKKKLEKIARKVQAGSLDPKAAADAATETLATMLAVAISTEIGSTVADQVQPLRRIGIPDAAREIMRGLGVYSLAEEIARMPVDIGVLTGLRYWYNQQFTPRIPSLSDLIQMLVREVITLDEYRKYAAWLGESREWADRRWEAHWQLPARTWIDDAYHRGIITEEEWSKYYVWHDYKPEPRPGISKSDVEILSGLRKTLIPRVDLRRAWEYGLIDDEELEQRYVMLGYEDDAPLMAKIQKWVALDGEITMVRRELVNLVVAGLMTEEEFDKALEDLKTLHDREWYWRMLARLRKKRKEKEPVPELPPVPIY
mgnify:CR=1 FL=1